MNAKSYTFYVHEYNTRSASSQPDPIHALTFINLLFIKMEGGHPLFPKTIERSTYQSTEISRNSC